MKNNVAAVTVLFNPEKKFISNIFSYASNVGLLILVDNSEIHDADLFLGLQQKFKVELIVNRENKGIAAALNQGITLAGSRGFLWALTMDQDSYFEHVMIDKYSELLDILSEKEKIAVIGPVFEKNIQQSDPEFKPVTSLITSGSLVNISVFDQVGGYNEALFIDEVDHEYCYRAKISGFSIIQLLHVFLQHNLGNTKILTTISGKTNKIKTFHSPLRLYYIVRNSCYVIKTFKSFFPAEMKLKRRDVLVRIKNHLLYADDKIAILKAVLSGYVDCKKNKFGKHYPYRKIR